MKRLLGVLAAVATAATLCLWTAPAVGAHEHAAAADCAAKTAAQAKRVANLESQAVTVEYNVPTKHGPATRYNFARQRGNPNGVTIIGAHVGGEHGQAAGWSEPYEYGSTEFYWMVEPAILHWISDPCSGSDQYAYQFFAECLKNPIDSGEVPTSCNWNVYAALKASHDGATGSFTPVGGGYADIDTLDDTACGGIGGKHPIIDDAQTWVVAWVRSQVRFNAAGGYLTSHYRSTSKTMQANPDIFGVPHAYSTGSCAFVFCSGGPTPSPITVEKACL
jgi:hypothetical protein